MNDTTMNTGAASLSDERERAAITACALMIKGICLTRPNAEWTGAIEDRIQFMLKQMQAGAAIAAGGAQETVRPRYQYAQPGSPEFDGAEAYQQHLEEQDSEPVAWVRYRSDGGFEGPIMDTDARMCDTRRSFWTPLYAAPLANEASKPAAQQTLSDGAQFFACYLIDNCENEVVREESVQAWLGKMLTSPRYHPAAPSVEQDERVAFEAAWSKVYDTGDFLLRHYSITEQYVNHDTQRAWEGWKLRAASTSANGAQGAVAVATVKVYETYTGQNGWTEVAQEEYDRTKDKYEHRIRRVPAPPAQTALTEVGFVVHDELHGWHFAPTVAWTYLGKGRALYALTAAQSASGDTK